MNRNRLLSSYLIGIIGSGQTVQSPEEPITYQVKNIPRFDECFYSGESLPGKRKPIEKNIKKNRKKNKVARKARRKNK